MPLWFPSFHHSSMEDSSIGFRAFIPNDPVKHRKRTTSEQLNVLEDVFKRDTKPTLALRSDLAAQLNMTPRGVQVWFQNRRAKAKKATKGNTPDRVLEEPHSSSSPCQSVIILSDGNTGVYSQHREIHSLVIPDHTTGPTSIKLQDISGDISSGSPWQSSTADECRELKSPLLDFYLIDESLPGNDVHSRFSTRTRAARVTSLPYPPHQIPRVDIHPRRRSADAALLSASFQRRREMPGEHMQFLQSQTFTPPISAPLLPSHNFSFGPAETNTVTPGSVFSDESTSGEFTPQSSDSKQFFFDGNASYDMDFNQGTNSSTLDMHVDSDWSLGSVSPESRRMSFSDSVSPDTAMSDMSDAMSYSSLHSSHAVDETFRQLTTSGPSTLAGHEDGIAWEQYTFKR